MLLLALALTAIETLTTSDDHFDKYASIAFDRGGTMWVAYASMHDEKTAIVVRSKRGGKWSAEQRLDSGEGFEGHPRLGTDARGNIVAVWHGLRAGRCTVYSRALGKGGETRVSPPDVDALHPAVQGGTIAYEVVKKGGF